MTRTASFANHPATNTAAMGQRPSPASALVEFFRKALFARPAAKLGAGRRDDMPLYPWLPARVRRNMTVRARRLMRADD